MYFQTGAIQEQNRMLLTSFQRLSTHVNLRYIPSSAKIPSSAIDDSNSILGETANHTMSTQ